MFLGAKGFVGLVTSFCDNAPPKRQKTKSTQSETNRLQHSDSAGENCVHEAVNASKSLDSVYTAPSRRSLCRPAPQPTQEVKTLRTMSWTRKSANKMPLVMAAHHKMLQRSILGICRGMRLLRSVSRLRFPILNREIGRWKKRTPLPLRHLASSSPRRRRVTEGTR